MLKKLLLNLSFPNSVNALPWQERQQQQSMQWVGIVIQSEVKMSVLNLSVRICDLSKHYRIAFDKSTCYACRYQHKKADEKRKNI